MGIPTIMIWASVPHYVHNAPSPKAVLALIDKLEELVDVTIPRGTLVDEAAAWEAGIDALAADDEEMASYIQQLEQARPSLAADDFRKKSEAFQQKVTTARQSAASRRQQMQQVEQNAMNQVQTALNATVADVAKTHEPGTTS